jgi:putative membrane protein
MQDFLLGIYDWLRALHIIAVISWMAGMLYLPRLYVYHCAAEAGSELSETLKIMERRLLRLIINPAMIVTWLLGLSMLYSNPSLLQNPWMHVKLTCLVLMQLVHAFFARSRRNFDADKNTRSQKFYRFANEAPTVLMIIIVIMVIVRPFSG